MTCYFRHLQHIFKKYPGGVEAQKKLLEREGHEVIQKGKQHVVVEYEKRLQKL